MIKLKSFASNFRLWRNDFSPYYKRENNLLRILIIHSIVAFVISPTYTLIIKLVNAPDIYFYLGLSYTVLFPFYVLTCWKIKTLNNKLIYFFITHLFAVTIIAFYTLVVNHFDSIELFMFSGLFVVSVLVIQRSYPLLLYILMVLFLFIYAFTIVKEVNDFTFIISINLLIISISAFVILFVRIRMMNTMDNYSIYLQQIIDSSGTGYVLFNIKDEYEILDFNNEIEIIFNLKSPTKQTIKEKVIQLISIKEKKIITELSVGKTYTKLIKIEKFGVSRSLEYQIGPIKIHNKIKYIARIDNITEELVKRETIELSEKKYRNLYQKNKAGVFTVDKNSVIINGNESFFKMLDSLCSIGDRLFTIDYQKDWSLILEWLSSNEYTQNYQTQFKLSNGKEKTFVFNWYLDAKTQYIEGSVIDVTKIQKASLDLKQSEEKYRLIFEETNDAIFFLQEDKILDVNKKATQLFGLSQRQLKEMNLFELSDDTSELNKEKYITIKENNKNSRSIKFEWIFNGNGKKIEAELVLIEITIGKEIYYQCVLHDNTERNEHIRSVESSQQNLTNILENHPEGIIICNNKVILFTNPEIEKILGNSIILETIFTNKDYLIFSDLYEEHIKDRERKNVQLNIIDKNESSILMDITLASTIFEEDESVLIILKDVSVSSKIEREKLRAELAEESNIELEREIKERIFAEKQLEEQFLRMKAILDSSSNTFLLTLTLDSKISSFNTHCNAYFSTILRKKIKEGEEFYTYFENALSPLRLRFFKQVFLNIKKGRSKQFELDIDINGIHHWMEVFVNPIFNIEGEVSEISLVAHDISEKKQASIEIESSLQEKEILLKEIHHRVKNNLQVISSILNLQSSFVEDEKTLSILQESRNRVRTMAIIHENLYRTKDFSSINFSNYLDNLTGNLISSYRINEEIELKKDLTDVQLVLDQAIPCGLIINEIITNSLKYAWSKNEKGVIFISLKEENNVVYLEVSDDGIGLPFDFKESVTDTLGLQLVETLIEQLDGDINVNTESGTKYLINFDKIKP